MSLADAVTGFLKLAEFLRRTKNCRLYPGFFNYRVVMEEISVRAPVRMNYLISILASSSSYVEKRGLKGTPGPAISGSRT